MHPKEKIKNGEQDYLEYLEQLTDHMFDGILVEKNGIVIYCNSAFEKIFNIHKHDFIDKNIVTVFEMLGISDALNPEAHPNEHQAFVINQCKVHLNHFVIDSGAASTRAFIFRSISQKIIPDEFSSDLQDILETLGEVYGHAYHGMVIVDAEGRIIQWDYEALLGFKEADVLGKYVEDVIENTRMHIVVKTGKKEIFQLQKVNGRYLLTSRIPIFKNGKLIGAVGTTFFKNADELRIILDRIDSLENTVNKYKREISHFFQPKYRFKDIITQNDEMNQLIEIAIKASKSSSSILIQGESGTGKEFFAHAIHSESNRNLAPFVTINCAAIPKDLLEAELFGYEEGAFTGAKKHGKLGKFELAHGGCIFLDEIGAMPVEMQAKLLRVLEAREFEHVGGTSHIELDSRIIAATNEDLEEKVRQGQFRQDLYYRLNVIRLVIPPLRNRIDDIPLLSLNILNTLPNDLLEGKTPSINAETMKILMLHHWPGNVRELRNVIERAVNLSQGEEITPNYLPDYLLEKYNFSRTTYDDMGLLKYTVLNAEREAISRTLRKYNNNKTLAAKALGIHRTSLYKKMEACGIETEDV